MLQSVMNPIIWGVLGLVGLVTIAALAYTTRRGEDLGKLSAVWLWAGLLVLLVLGVIVVWLWILPRRRERRFIAAQQPEESTTPEHDAEERHRQLRGKILEAIQTLQRSPDLRQKPGLPLYALPWYLLVGSSQCGKTTLLRGVASRFAPFGRPASSANGPTQDCNWWFFKTAIILDTSGRYALPTQVERDSAEWYRLLQLLRQYREQQPVNGMIVAVAVTDLVAKAQEELRFEATALRKRIDEAIRELGVDFPVYLLLTQCDALEGFTDFFGCFPAQTRQQVLGFINELRSQASTSQPQAASAPLFEGMFTSMVERLQQLRLSLLLEKPPTGTLRQRVFCFPEEFRALQQPLGTFVEVLFGANPYQHTPFLRGLFFCSAQQQGTPVSFVRRELHFEDQGKPLPDETKDYFLYDLFSVILPRDQGLVRRTPKARRATRLKGLFGFASCIVLCLIAAWLLLQAYRRDREVHMATDTGACRMASEVAHTGPLLDQADKCRHVVQQLIDHNHQHAVLGKALFNRSGTLEERLRQGYVEQFERAVLAPLDAGVTRHLAAGSDTPLLALLLLDRLDLLAPCLAAEGCPALLVRHGQPDYRLMLAAALPQVPPQEQVNQLQLTYEAYLRWSSGPKAALRREQEGLIDRLQGWLTSAPVVSQVLVWVNQRYPPVTAHEYWDVPPPAERDKPVQVAGAYTRAGWEEGLLPLVQRASRAVPGAAQALGRLRSEYATQYFAQWRHFLEAFPRGQAAWTQGRERRLQLTLRLLDARSPYNRIIDVAFTNLQPLLPTTVTPDAGAMPSVSGTDLGEARAAAHQGEVPAWSHVLQRYVGSESRKAYLEALQQLGKQLAGNAMKTRSFELAQLGFQEGMPTEKATHPILKAWWIIDQFQHQENGADPAATAAFWPLLRGPILLVWKVILEEASVTLQERWNDLLLEVRDLPPSQKHELLYGKEGKAVAFIKGQGPAAVFLQRRGEEYMRGKLLESELPLTDAFLLYLKQARVGLPTPVPEAAKRRVLIRATPASVEANGNLKVAKTELILDCDTGRQVLATTDAGTDLTFVWAVNSCTETFLRLHLAETSGQPLEPLERRYQDLAQFLEQFSTFQRVFRLADFKVENTAQFSSYGIKAITLRYRFPPENRQQIQKDMDDYKHYLVDVQKRLDLPVKIVATSP